MSFSNKTAPGSFRSLKIWRFFYRQRVRQSYHRQQDLLFEDFCRDLFSVACKALSLLDLGQLDRTFRD